MNDVDRLNEKQAASVIAKPEPPAAELAVDEDVVDDQGDDEVAE